MRMSPHEIRYRVSEFLYNFGGASRKDLSIAFGRETDSGALTGCLRQLEEDGCLRTRSADNILYYSLTPAGRKEVEEAGEDYREMGQYFRRTRLSDITASAGTREAAALCMNCSGLPDRDGKKQKIAVYAREKPQFFFLVYLMKNGGAHRCRDAGPYRSVMQEGDLEKLLEGGVFYSSVELKQYFSENETDTEDGTVNRGGEAMYSSRVTGVLFGRERFYVFYRSAGPIPRFRYEVENRFLSALWDSVRSYRPYAEAGDSRPAALMISRSPELIPALIMGYSRGRVKNPASMDGSTRSQKNRKYYENRFFNPCCGLFREVYCIPYRAKSAPELAYVLGNDKRSICREGTDWLMGRPGYFFMPRYSYWMRDFSCGSDERNHTDVLYAPVIDILMYRMYLREYITSDQTPSYTVVTTRANAKLLSHAVGRKIAAFRDIRTGETFRVPEYDVYGYPLDGKDRYAEASRKRWGSPDRPFRNPKRTLCLPPAAAQELDALADASGCPSSRIAGQLLASVMDTPAWQDLCGRSHSPSFADQLLEQDLKNGNHAACAQLLRRCGSLAAAGRDKSDDGE